MCIENVGPIRVMKEDTIAYKVVRVDEEEKFWSQYEPQHRAAAAFCDNFKGDRLEYKIGEAIYSSFEETPGLYCYTERPRLFDLRVGEVRLKVCIPEGTRYRLARTAIWNTWPTTWRRHGVILAERIVPLSLLSQPELEII